MRIRFAVTACVLATVSLTGVGHAGTITYLGQDQSTLPSWRDSTVAKPAALTGGTNGSGDPNGDNVYGSDGYHVYVVQAVAPNLTTPTSSLPSYISGVAQASGLATWSDSSYGMINDPTVVGGLPSKRAVVLYKNVPTEQDFLTITLAADSTFVMGVVGGTWGGPTNDIYNFNRLRVRQVVGGAADSTLLTVAFLKATPYYDFFRISGVAGDQFTVSAQRTPSATGVSLTGLSFEAIPEPASLGMLALGGLMIAARRHK
ncbi:MAG: PEP-CTERM sorting domain-containing protein [Phycisphaerales bacterium]